MSIIISYLILSQDDLPCVSAVLSDTSNAIEFRISHGDLSAPTLLHSITIITTAQHTGRMKSSSYYIYHSHSIPSKIAGTVKYHSATDKKPLSPHLIPSITYDTINSVHHA
jgi:hypothetical protein